MGIDRTRLTLVLVAGAVIGVAGFALANQAVIYAGTNAFCASACHTMEAADHAYRRGPHFANAVGVPATCSDCHIPFESERNKGAIQWAKLVAFKAKVGLTDVVDEWRGTISTPQKWEAERARLNREVHAFVRRTDSLTCRGCHDLGAFAKGTMYELVHADQVRAATVDCVSCHSGVAHVYDHPAQGAPPAAPLPDLPGTVKAVAPAGPLADLVAEGRTAFDAHCASCHRKGGTDLNALPLLGAAAAYPAEVDGKVMTLEDRVDACFVQHVGERPPAPASAEMRGLVAYVTSLSQGRRMSMSASGGGPRKLEPMARDASFWSAQDAAKGKALYASMCSSCHGADGTGGAGPAVWGPKAFSASSAMGKPAKLAAYLSSAMGPYVGSLTGEQARDLAAFLESQPRPGDPAGR